MLTLYMLARRQRDIALMLAVLAIILVSIYRSLRTRSRALAICAAAVSLTLGSVTPANAQAAKTIAIGIGLIIGKITGKEIGKHNQTPEELGKAIREHHAEMDAELDRYAAHERKLLPKKYNDDGSEDVYLTNLGRDGNWLFFVYVQSNVYEIANYDETVAVKAYLMDKVCALKELKPLLLGGYGVAYWYYNPDRKTLVASVKLTADDCVQK
jgi:hypothetical protein